MSPSQAPNLEVGINITRPWYKNVLVLAFYAVVVFAGMVVPGFLGHDIPESVMTIGGALIGGLLTLCMTLLKDENTETVRPPTD